MGDATTASPLLRIPLVQRIAGFAARTAPALFRDMPLVTAAWHETVHCYFPLEVLSRMVSTAAPRRACKETLAPEVFARACESGNMQRVEQFVAAGCDVKEMDYHFAKEVWHARPIVRAVSAHRVEVVRRVLALGTSHSRLGAHDRSLMHAAGADPMMIAALCDCGVAINARSRPDGETPLMKLARSNYCGIAPAVMMLMHRGADIDLTDTDGTTVLQGGRVPPWVSEFYELFKSDRDAFIARLYKLQPRAIPALAQVCTNVRQHLFSSSSAASPYQRALLVQQLARETRHVQCSASELATVELVQGLLTDALQLQQQSGGADGDASDLESQLEARVDACLSGAPRGVSRDADDLLRMVCLFLRDHLS